MKNWVEKSMQLKSMISEPIESSINYSAISYFDELLRHNNDLGILNVPMYLKCW